MLLDALFISFAEAQSGVFGWEGYEALILHFSEMPYFNDSNDDHLQILVHSAISWLLDRQALHGSHQAPRVLEKMCDIAKAILWRGGRTCYYGQTDATWLSAILTYDDRHNESYSQSPRNLRQLLHVFEQSYKAQILVGDQADIRRSLHTLLEKTHLGVAECEALGCKWISHRCDSLEDDHHEVCPLLDIANAISSRPILSPAQDGTLRPLISGVPSTSEAEGSGHVPTHAGLGGSSSCILAVNRVPCEHVESVLNPLSAEPSSSNLSDVQSTDVPPSLVSGQRLPSATPEPVTTASPAQDEKSDRNPENASITSKTAVHSSVPRRSSSGTSIVVGRADDGDIRRDEVRVSQAARYEEDAGRAVVHWETHLDRPDLAASGTPAVASGPPHDFTSEPEAVGATPISIANDSPDVAATISSAGLGRASPIRPLIRPDVASVLTMSAGSDPAERSQTATNSTAAMLRASSPLVRDSAWLFPTVDEIEPSAVPPFEMEDLSESAVEDREEDRHGEEAGNRSGVGYNERENAEVVG